MKAFNSKQNGAALMAFTMALAIVTFTIVMGYSVSATKHEAASLALNQLTYLEDVKAKLTAMYLAESGLIDAMDGGGLTSGNLLTRAGVISRWGVEASISPVLSREGVQYRTFAAYLPLEHDNGLDTAIAWNSDGTFNPCVPSTSECLARRKYVTTDGFGIQRENVKKALKQLEQLSLNAQAFFKAKTMLDPEHNVSVNYFRPPYGGCSAITEQMPCLDTPAPIYGVSPAIQQVNSTQSMTELLGIPNAPVLNPWGIPVEACNGPGCVDPITGRNVRWDPGATSAPYSMVFLSKTPWGMTYRIYAIQQL